MTDVAIRRCTLRVVRRGGWSWGPDPRRMLEGAVEALPDLLAQRLAGLLPEDAAGEISAPLRLRVAVRSDELAAVGRRSAGAAPPPALAARLDRAFCDALPAELVAQAATAQTPEPRVERPVEPPRPLAERLLNRLLAWRESGELEAWLGRLPEPLLARWYDRLLAGGPVPVVREVLESELAALFERLAEEAAAAAEPARPLVWRLVALAEAAAVHGVPPHAPALRPLLERALPFAQPAASVPAEPLVAPTGLPDEPTDAPVAAPPQAVLEDRPEATAGHAITAVPRPLGEVEVEVATALPWLVLGPLSRMGYLEALGAALELAGLAGEASSFAAALAYKLAAPPERGWRRAASASLVAAAFAGLETAPPEDELHDFARRAAAACALPTAELARVTLAGRAAAEPLLVWAMPEAGGGWLLLDPAGLFPAAWEETPEGLAALAAAAGAHDLMVPAASATPGLLAALAAAPAGVRFLVPAPPARGEPWRPLPGPLPGRWWSNRPGRLHSAARRVLGRRDELEALAGELVEELVVRRPALPLDRGGALERGVTLAAASALGSIAWALWRRREPVSPVLALERFGNLDARVRFGRRRVQVRLPLGRRHQDLLAAGFLANVADVPWLGGRRLELSAG